VRAVLSLVAATALAALAASAAGAVAPPCATGSLTGTFTVVPGSAGAGSIVYALRLRNRSASACFVSGQVGLELLGGGGRPLPTHARPARKAVLTAVRVTLAPGGYASRAYRVRVAGRRPPGA
jgi:hypothetical protein